MVQQTEEMCEALILLLPGEMEGIQRTMEAIEAMSGRVLLSFPPHAIVASLPTKGVKALRDYPGILSVDTEEITGDRLNAVPEAIRMAIVAWNEHLARQRAPQQPPSVGLPWDAPGCLPPDLPRDTQEMLRRREQNMQTD
jgi:hypothetical protein